MTLKNMKTVEELIKRVRRETRNATLGSTTAGASIKDIEFIDKLNDAQEDCVELMSGLFAPYFERIKTYTIDTSVTDYEQLALPDYLLLGTRICLVEYSYTGRDADYVNITPVDLRERYTGNSWRRSIFGYTLTGNKLILSEKPKNGSTVRVTYEIAPPRLDVVKLDVLTAPRNGTLIIGTFTTPSTVDTDGDGVMEASLWAVGDSVTIMDSSSNTVLVRDGVLADYDYATGDFAVDLTSATYDVDIFNSADEENMRLIEGGRTNVPELPDHCERYLVHNAIVNIFGRDGSKLAQAAEKRLSKTEASLQKSYLTATKDWPMVPELDN